MAVLKAAIMMNGMLNGNTICQNMKGFQRGVMVIMRQIKVIAEMKTDVRMLDRAHLFLNELYVSDLVLAKLSPNPFMSPLILFFFN